MGCLLMGAAVGTLAWSAQGDFSRWLGYVESDLADKLRRLRVPAQNLHRYVVLWLSATGANFVVFWLVLESPVFAVLLSVFLLCGPWYLLRRMAQRRRQKIEDQLADAMVMLANAVRAGLSLAQSMDVLAAQCPSPINFEFRQIVGEYNMGKPLEQTLLEARTRLRSENFALFAAAMMASHQSGGRLNEIVERIAQAVLEMQRLERKVQAETAQARKSAVYMAIAPVVILVVYYFVDPESTRRLFSEPMGHLILAAAVVLDVVAYFWARWILTSGYLEDKRIDKFVMRKIITAFRVRTSAERCMLGFDYFASSRIGICFGFRHFENSDFAHFPLAVLPAGIGMEAIASVLIGAAMAVLVWWVLQVLESEDLEQGSEWRYDVSRMNELRRIDPLYRLFNPVFTVSGPRESRRLPRWTGRGPTPGAGCGAAAVLAAGGIPGPDAGHWRFARLRCGFTPWFGSSVRRRCCWRRWEWFSRHGSCVTGWPPARRFACGRSSGACRTCSTC